MSERIDARGDITITGASADAVRGELTALTRWGPTGRAVLSAAGAVAQRAWGCAEESEADGGDRQEPHHRRRPDPPGGAAMTAADRTPECYTQCVPRLTRLRLLARGGGAPLPPGAAGEVGHAARAIVAETGAAGQAAVAAVAEGRRSSAAVFLAARQARLAAAAEDLVAAAAGGSAAALSRPLRRFEALATALWTVQSDLRPASPPRAGAPSGTGSPMRTPDRGPAASGP